MESTQEPLEVVSAHGHVAEVVDQGDAGWYFRLDFLPAKFFVREKPNLAPGNFVKVYIRNLDAIPQPTP